MANLSSFYQLFGDVPNKTLKGLDPTSTSALFSNARGQDVYLLASSGVENRGGDVVLSGGRGGVSTDGSALGGAVSIYGGDAIATDSIGGLVRIYGGDSEAGETGSVLISSYYNAGIPNVAPTITLGSFAGGDGGGITISTGLPTSGFVSGSLSILTNSGVGGGSGEIEIYTGTSESLGVSGAVSLYTGDSANETGAMTLITGDAPNLSGVIQIKTGEAETSGSLVLLTGVATLSSGDVIVASGDSSEISGVVNIYSGEANDDSGSVIIHTGDTVSVGGVSGDLSINTGDGIYSSGGVTLETGASNRPGDITIQAGNTTATTLGFNAGDVTLQAGSSTSFSNAGDVYLVAGSGGSNAYSGSLDITAKSILWDSSSPSLLDSLLLQIVRDVDVAVNGVFNLTSDGDLSLYTNTYNTQFQTSTLDFTTADDDVPLTLTVSSSSFLKLAVDTLMLENPTASQPYDLYVVNDNYTLNLIVDTLTLQNTDSTEPFNLSINNDDKALTLNADIINLKNKTDPTDTITINAGLPGTGDLTLNVDDLRLKKLNGPSGAVVLHVGDGVTTASSDFNLDVTGDFRVETGADVILSPGNDVSLNATGDIKLSSSDIATSAISNRLLQIGLNNVVSALGFKFEIVEVGSVTTSFPSGTTYDFYFQIPNLYNTATDHIFYSIVILKDVNILDQLYFRDYTSTMGVNYIYLKGHINFGATTSVTLNYLIYRI